MGRKVERTAAERAERRKQMLLAHEANVQRFVAAGATRKKKR